MGGKKNKRNRRKQKQMKGEPERAEGPTSLDEGSSEGVGLASLDEGPSVATGLASLEAGPSEQRLAVLGEAADYVMLQEGAQSFNYRHGSTDESKNIITETLQLLKRKDAEVNELSEMLNDAMHNWLKDMLKKVEIVKSEISTTRDLVLPTCAVLDKLKNKPKEAEDIGKLVHSILDKVENMVKQLPATTAVVGIVMEQIDLLQMEDSPMACDRHPGVVQIKSSSSAESNTQEISPVTSVSDLESDKLQEHPLQESINAIPSDGEPIPVEKEARQEVNDQDPSISEEMFTIMKIKDTEIDEFKDLLTDLMKSKVKDMLKNIDLAATEAEVIRNLAVYATDVIESLKRTPVEVDELKSLVHVLFRKVDYINYQISAATKIVDCTVEQISQLERTEDFRNEIIRDTIYDSSALLDSSNEAQPEADLVMAISELHMQNSDENPGEQNPSGLHSSRSGDMADESYLTEEHMRGISTDSSDGAEDDSYVLEASAFLELVSPEKRRKLDYTECSENEIAMSQACSNFVNVQDCFQEKATYFENDGFVLQPATNECGHDSDHMRYFEDSKEFEVERICAAEDGGKNFASVQEVVSDNSSDEDSMIEETESEEIWLFRLARQG